MFAELAVEPQLGWLGDSLRQHMRFWSGAAPPEAVSKDDAWKCGFCAFQQQCQAGVYYKLQGAC